MTATSIRGVTAFAILAGLVACGSDRAPAMTTGVGGAGTGGAGAAGGEGATGGTTDVAATDAMPVCGVKFTILPAQMLLA